MALTLTLPRRDGTLHLYRMAQRCPFARSPVPIRGRVAFAAVHVVADPLADHEPWLDARLDWEATLAYRRYVWSLGLAVAEATEAAQRGLGLGWPAARELIRRSLAEAQALGGAPIVCGAGTEQADASPAPSLEEVEAAWQEQCAWIEQHGGRVLLLGSRALARCARGPDDYAAVYGRVLARLSRPAIVDWPSGVLDPLLAGYWGHHDPVAAAEVLLAVVADHASRVEGVSLSMLDRDRQAALRGRLPAGVRLYAGDGPDFPAAIRGDGDRGSDALLATFDPIAPAAAAALRALDAGDVATYEAILAPCVALARHLFQPPAGLYRTGVAFLAYLNGHQAHFRMVAGLEGARSVVHLGELFVLADQAGLLRDPDLAAERMRRLLALAGLD
jgi:hypothetical protein